MRPYLDDDDGGEILPLPCLLRELEEFEPCRGGGMTEEPDRLPLVGGVIGCLELERGSSPPRPCAYLGTILGGKSGLSRSLSLKLLFDLSLDLCLGLLPCLLSRLLT